MVEKSPRPKSRPPAPKESKPSAPKKSLRPKSREQVRIEDEMRQFGNLEFRADMEDQLSWNPLARLGFEPDQSVVGRPAYNSPDIHEGIRYPYDSDQDHIDENLPRAAFGAEYRDIVGRVKPGSVVVNSNTAKNPVWSHEYTHGGIEKVIEYLDEDREFFTEKYGEDTVRLLDEIRTDTNRSEGPNEKLTEMLDDISKDDEVDIHGHLIPAAGTALGKMDNTRTAVSDYETGTDRVQLRKNLEEGRVNDADASTKLFFEQNLPGYMGIFEAAEDMLEARGEPLPTEKRGWIKRTLSKMGFNQGGEVMNNQMEMAFMKQGGIKDDGMNKDPVSGNNVPPGSLAKEVRDDIPAMLSEGEYVIPADVLRFYGVNFFENLRGQAKQGLNTMEQNGRIGGTPMTDQDVARNMQQPMMAPAPVQAAQGALMQSPMRVQQQQAPQAMGNVMQKPVMANQGMMVQGFDEGTTGAVRSSWTPARARYSSPMFQGTSSQQANIQTAQEQAAAELLTFMRTHFNKDGESIQIAYEGTDPNSATPKAGQEELLASYPLTEAEYSAYQSEVKKSNGGGDGGGDGGETPTPSGSDTSWMDGINFDDPASVREWVESDDGLGMSGAARQLANMGVLGLVPQGIQANDVAKVRGIRSYYESIGDDEMVKYLDGELKGAVKEGGLLFSALDKLGLISGDSYSKQIASSIPDLRKKFTDTSGDMVKDEGGASVYKPGGIDVAMLDTSDDGPGLTAAEQHAVNTSRARASASRAAVEEAFEAGASTNTAEEIQDFKEKVEEAGGTWNVGGRAEGGLMTTPKPKTKKKSKPKKTGLAGKK